MTAAIALGTGAGLGVLGFCVALRGRRQTLDARLRILDVDGATDSDRAVSRVELQGFNRQAIRANVQLWLGKRTSLAIDRLPAVRDALSRDLASVGWTMDVLAEKFALSSLAGALLPFAVWAVLSFRGVEMPLVLPVWVGLSGASAGAALPILALRRRAKRERRTARRMVGCFLDLVVLALAGGLGIGDSRVSHQMARCLDEARDAGRTPWDALERLGHEIVVPELVELSSAVSLAGTEGARIKSTLAAKAASIRRHELADAEADANTISERLFIPGVLLLIGFVVFIGYPAVARLSSGF
jgi:tight adherence protein C